MKQRGGPLCQSLTTTKQCRQGHKRPRFNGSGNPSPGETCSMEVLQQYLYVTTMPTRLNCRLVGHGSLLCNWFDHDLESASRVFTHKVTPVIPIHPQDLAFRDTFKAPGSSTQHRPSPRKHAIHLPVQPRHLHQNSKPVTLFYYSSSRYSFHLPIPALISLCLRQQCIGTPGMVPYLPRKGEMLQVANKAKPR